MPRILVIDDDAETRGMLEETLTSAGHEVALASDGREGIRKYREKPADVVITDLFMPNQEGLETITKLIQSFPGASIIAISGHMASTNMLLVARQLGAAALLQKPFFSEELLTTLERVLHQRKGRAASGVERVGKR